MPQIRDLRHCLRSEEPSPATVILRGGPATDRKLAAHALRTARAFTLDAKPVLGISAFAALDDVGPASLTGILERMSSYRVVHFVERSRLEHEGFEVLSTFQRPHVTIVLRSTRDVPALVSILGPEVPNPRYGAMTRRPRRRPT